MESTLKGLVGAACAIVFACNTVGEEAMEELYGYRAQDLACQNVILDEKLTPQRLNAYDSRFSCGDIRKFEQLSNGSPELFNQYDSRFTADDIIDYFTKIDYPDDRIDIPPTIANQYPSHYDGYHIDVFESVYGFERVSQYALHFSPEQVHNFLKRRISHDLVNDYGPAFSSHTEEEEFPGNAYEKLIEQMVDHTFARLLAESFSIDDIIHLYHSGKKANDILKYEGHSPDRIIDFIQFNVPPEEAKIIVERANDSEIELLAMHDVSPSQLLYFSHQFSANDILELIDREIPYFDANRILDREEIFLRPYSLEPMALWQQVVVITQDDSFKKIDRYGDYYTDQQKYSLWTSKVSPKYARKLAKLDEKHQVLNFSQLHSLATQKISLDVVEKLMVSVRAQILMDDHGI